MATGKILPFDPAELKQQPTRYFFALQVVSNSMSALARTTEINCDTRAANEDCINGGSRTRTKYSYDGWGRRTGINTSSGTTLIQVYDQSGQLLYAVQTQSGVSQTTRYVYLGRNAIAQTNSASGTSFLHTDLLGSLIATSNPSKSILTRTRYDAYGNTAAGTSPPALGFAGNVSDTHTTGFIYMQQRYYDPVAGRFLSVDPIATASNAAAFNRYTYVDNDPYGKTDPTGQCPLCLIPLVIEGAELIEAAALAKAAVATTGVLVAGAVADHIVHSDSSKSGESSQGPGKGPTVNEDKQGKHQPGQPNFQPGKSELTHPDPQGLVDRGAGTGDQVGNTPVGEAGSKERVDFGEPIGNHVDPTTGAKTETSRGIIHYGKDDVHIVPARPAPDPKP
jgi:RHS repeat-associated protein